MFSAMLSIFLAFSFFCTSYWAAPIISVPNTEKNQVLLETLGLDFSCMGTTPEKLNFHLDETAERILERHGNHKKALFSGSTLAVEDVEAQFEALMNEDDLGVYHTFAEVESELQNAAVVYSDLTNLSVAAITYESRPIYVLEITNKKSKQEKVNFLVTGTHHAREWISTEVPMAFIAEFLTRYGEDDEVTQLLNTSRIFVIPMLNPDGAVYSRTQKRMWRKNRRKNRWGTGVDNNRNYSYKWGGSGASSSAWSDTFRGPSAMSEVENQVIENLQEEHGFSAAISFHSYSELILWPWGYTASMQTRDHAFFLKHGTVMGQIMDDYEPIQASGLYAASGIFDDYLYGEHNVAAYTIELGRQFIPAQSEVPEITSRGVKMLRYVFKNIRNGLSPDQQESEVYQLAGEIQNLVRSIIVGQDDRNILQASQSIREVTNQKLHEAFDLLNMKEDLRKTVRKTLQQTQNFQ
tara:strand:- start:345 stop:1739 length:1395 start_codon:yes stop_codon:yes gene_type:complete